MEAMVADWIQTPSDLPPSTRRRMEAMVAHSTCFSWLDFDKELCLLSEETRWSNVIMHRSFHTNWVHWKTQTSVTART